VHEKQYKHFKLDLPHILPLEILALKYSAASEAYSAPLSEISNKNNMVIYIKSDLGL